MTDHSSYFKVGGTLSRNAPSYVTRSADKELLEALRQDELCLVLAPRQIGKSSLVVRTWENLKLQGVSAGIVDLQAFGSEKDEQKWFMSVIVRIARRLRLKVDALEWWDNQRTSTTERFMTFLESVVLPECTGKVVIFFDEIDSILPLPFSDDFFTSIRSLYNSRAVEPALENLTFVLVGTTTASSFIKERSRTPFNIGRKIELKDFSLDSMGLIGQGLKEDSEEVLERIFYWTNGHPALVQELAAAVKSWEGKKEIGGKTKEEQIDEIKKWIDEEVSRRYLERKNDADVNLQFAQNYLLDQNSSSEEILSEYQRILEGREIYFEENSLIHNKLWLSGVIRLENNRIFSRNRIYRNIFDLNWVKLHNSTDVAREIEDARKGKAISLDLSGRNLIKLPVGIGQLKSLKSLNVSNNNLSELSNEISQLSELEKIDLSFNQLEFLPKWLKQLSNLTEILIHENRLISVPGEIGSLKKLSILSLFGNRLTSIPKELGQLTSLSKLTLDENKIEILPKELGQLVRLNHLSLDGNKLVCVPKELGCLKRLTRLSIARNKLSSIPEELGQLVNLEELFLFGNYLTSIPRSIGQLANLNSISLDENELYSLPKELGRLSQLTYLSLSSNRLGSVPKEIGQLRNLSRLSISRNELTSVPRELGKLANLEELILFQNRLTSIPKDLRELRNLNQLFLHDNERLNISSDILGPTFDDVVLNKAQPAIPRSILDYYFRVQTGQTALNEAKLIFVGFGAVGKTSLVNRLCYGQFDLKSKKTEGIQITPWSIQLHNVKDQTTEDITLNVWDFGGQEIMHSTHQFFLTERSLYVLVLNGRQGHEDADAEYWLELIQSFGDDSPVIVVLNKVSEHPFSVNRRALKEKFDNIQAFVQTDCETEKGIEELRETIKQQTDRLGDLREPFPSSWISIKDELVNMADNYISGTQYREICRRNGEGDTSRQDSLSVYLHNLGIALNYKDDPRLRDTHILNPRWLTSAIYTLLNDAQITGAKGEFVFYDLAQVFDAQKYPRTTHGFILDLMRKFELCLRFEEDENRYLIPDLLDKQQPVEASAFIPAECLNFRYEYAILYEGLLPRFIVRTYVLSTQPFRWRTGVILRFEGNRALVKVDPQDRHVTISVEGPLPSRRRLLAIIRSDFDRIHSSFKSKPKELVPVPGHPTVTVSYKELLVREKKNKKSFEVFLDNDELIDLNVQDLLNGVDIDGSRSRNRTPDRYNDALRLFYSYSHKDETLRDQLDTHLKILERQGLILPWHDRRIIGGENWATEIDTNIKQADIVLLLVSADFIASDYCYEIEMQQAMEQHRKGKTQVIPIALRPADWRETPFKALQGFPTDMKAVTQWSDRDSAWLNVETGIKNTIEAIKARKLK